MIKKDEILYASLTALLFSAFIYFEHYGLTNKFINTAFGLGAIYMLLHIPKKAVLLVGFFIGLLWFYWIGYSFKYNGVGYLEPIITFAFGFIYMLFFGVLALTNKVYIGISAGSIVATHSLIVSSKSRLYSEEIGEHKDERGLGFVDFHVCPHFNSPHFPKCNKENLEKTAKELKEPMYAIDDQTAIKVIDTKVEVISEGEYLRFNL